MKRIFRVNYVDLTVFVNGAYVYVNLMEETKTTKIKKLTRAHANHKINQST